MIDKDTIAFLVDRQDPHKQEPVDDFCLFVGRLNPRYVGAWGIKTFDKIPLEAIIDLQISLRDKGSNRKKIIEKLTQYGVKRAGSLKPQQYRSYYNFLLTLK